MSTTPNVIGGTGRRLVVTLVFALVASVVAVVGGGGAAGADDAPAEVTVFAAGDAEHFHAVAKVTASLVQTFDATTLAPASPDSAGITYDPGTGDLVFTDSEINEYPYYEPARVNIWNVTPTAPPVQTATGSTLILSHIVPPCPISPDPPCPTPTSWSREPTGVTYSASRDRFWTTDDVRNDLFEIDPGGDGLLGTADDVRKKIIALEPFGSFDAEGVTYNAALDVLHIIDGASETILTLDPGPNGVFEGDGFDDIITSFGCFEHGCRSPEGIAWNSTTGRLAVLSKTGPKGIQEYSANGYHLRDIDISGAALDKPGGLTWAPGSGGGTSLWVVDRGVDAPSETGLPKDGRLFEFTVPAVPATPVQMVMPLDLPFGDVGVGEPITLPVSILNSGGAPMAGSASVTAGGPDFSVTPAGAFVLAPGEYFDAMVKFDPTSGSTPSIPFVGTLSVVSAGGSDSVSLSGGGVTPIPDISVAPTSAAFGDVEIGTEKDITVTVSNVGTKSLSVASTTVTGNAAFTLDSGGGAFDLGPGEMRDVVVKFAPAAFGSVDGNLAIASDDPDTPTLDVPLSGAGAAGFVAMTVPSSAAFGSVGLGLRGETTVKVTNSGTSPLTVSGLSRTGDSEISLLPGPLPFILSAGESMDVTVRFDPFSLGLYTGNLAVTSNAGTQNVALSGTGAAPLSCPTAATPFTDVPTSSFAYLDVKCIYGLEITTGTSPTTYSPADFVTREQMASFMARLYKVLAGTACPTPPTPFTDVPTSSFAYLDVKCIYGLGVTTGTSSTTYSPADFVTREQMASFLARLFKALTSTNHPETGHPFTDVPTSSFAFLDVGRIYNLEITTGTSPTTYSPSDFVTREQMAAFLARLIRLLSL